MVSVKDFKQFVQKLFGRREVFVFCLAFSTSFTMFLLTAANRLSALGDASEFAVATLLGGIPHPSGYPLFVLLAKIATFFPIDNKVLLINATSALYGALTCAFVALIVFYFTKNRIAAFWSALVLAASPLFWKYSSVSEIFTLNTLFAAVLFYLALIVRTKRWFLLYAFLLGLSLSNHLTAVLVFPSVIYIIWKRKLVFLSRKVMALAFLCFVLGFLPYLYLLMLGQSVPIMNWNNPKDLDGLAHLFLRSSYGTFNLSSVELPTDTVPRQIVDLVGQFKNEFTIVGILLFVIGIFRIFLINVRLGAVLLFTFLVTGELFILFAGVPLADVLYKPVTERFLILPSVFFVVIAGIGLSLFLGVFRRAKVRLFAGALCLLVPLFMIYRNFPLANQKDIYFAENLADDIFVTTPANSILMVVGDQTLPSVFYTRFVKGERQDLVVILPTLFSPTRYSWYSKVLAHNYPDIAVPEDNITYNENLMRFINANIGQRPIICACNVYRKILNLDIASRMDGLTEQFLPEDLGYLDLKEEEKRADLIISMYKNTVYKNTFSLGTMEAANLGDYAAFYIFLGDAYLKLHNYEEAERLYKKSLELSPNNFVCYLRLAQVYEDTGQLEKLRDAVHKYMEANPRDVTSPEIRERIEKLEGKLE